MGVERQVPAVCFAEVGDGSRGLEVIVVGGFRSDVEVECGGGGWGWCGVRGVNDVSGLGGGRRWGVECSPGVDRDVGHGVSLWLWLWLEGVLEGRRSAKKRIGQRGERTRMVSRWVVGWSGWCCER